MIDSAPLICHRPDIQLGLSTGRLFQDGRLVATVAQEGLIRPARERGRA